MDVLLNKLWRYRRFDQLQFKCIKVADAFKFYFYFHARIFQPILVRYVLSHCCVEKWSITDNNSEESWRKKHIKFSSYSGEVWTGRSRNTKDFGFRIISRLLAKTVKYLIIDILWDIKRTLNFQTPKTRAYLSRPRHFRRIDIQYITTSH